jgi:hypothetical protein
MTGKRKRHTAAFKAKVALEAAQQNRTIAERAKVSQVHPVQINPWKKRPLPVEGWPLEVIISLCKEVGCDFYIDRVGILTPFSAQRRAAD